jgi:hypothetical protein
MPSYFFFLLFPPFIFDALAFGFARFVFLPPSLTLFNYSAS